MTYLDVTYADLLANAEKRAANQKSPEDRLPRRRTISTLLSIIALFSTPQRLLRQAGKFYTFLRHSRLLSDRKR
jgi:hypothetical protein